MGGAELRETIAAIATPGGRGGIGIVRLSGPACLPIAQAVTGVTPRPRFAEYCTFRDRLGAVIDRGIMLFFKRPASYTGEDVVELHGHGGQVVMHMLLHRVLELGARLARPGEFTERAFLNGKLDLVQAEAVSDLIDSLSETAARSAMRSLEGEFSRRIGELRETLIRIRTFVESALDFPEEEVEFLSTADLDEQVRGWLQQLDGIATAARGGRVLRDGFRVVIAGPPNVGKSSLLNRLTESDRAIVDATPGTTRDTLEEGMVVGGIRMHIVDTAGIRDTADAVEAEGVRRARAAMESADLVLLVSEFGRADSAAASAVGRALPAGTHRLPVQNKIDLSGAAPCVDSGGGIALSAKTGAGVDLLLEALRRASDDNAGGEDVVLARDRHLVALAGARECVARGLNAWEQDHSAELLAEELRLGQDWLSRITGEFSTDDLLGEIFSRFCIGK